MPVLPLTQRCLNWERMRHTGETILNQTGEVAKKIVGGAANVLSNISGEIKEGVGDK